MLTIQNWNKSVFKYYWELYPIAQLNLINLNAERWSENNFRQVSYAKLLTLIFRWEIEFKTITQNSIILYNTGGGRGSDFLAVEILEGVIRVKMARGQIVHTVRVNDGQWHKMHLLFNPSLIEVILCVVFFSHILNVLKCFCEFSIFNTNVYIYSI